MTGLEEEVDYDSNNICANKKNTNLSNKRPHVFWICAVIIGLPCGV